MAGGDGDDGARAARDRCSGPVVTITGSNGKTTTSRLLAAMLDNHVYWGNTLNVDERRVAWRRNGRSTCAGATLPSGTSTGIR